MRVPVSWLREYADLPDVPARELADTLVSVGLEVESVERVGGDVAGVVVGRVVEVEELTGFKKPIRFVRVEVGEPEPRGVICGAVNFAAGDHVPVALPGALLPGPRPGRPVEIGARSTYGRVSDGMICSARELGLGEDHSGILVLPGAPPVGADVVDLLGLRDDVLDIAVTPDRGYCLSVRGVAREAATAYGVGYRDPAEVELPAGAGSGYPARIADPTACDRFVLREVRGLDPSAPTPEWMWIRLLRSGMRPVSLAVDVTNYVMLELGQPLHAFDRGKLTGPIVVRRAEPGERLETLDHVRRDLHPEDILITDDSGPISLAGTMGGLRTEIDERSTDLVIEAAHFSAPGTARMSRRHRLGSEASYRFERGVDRELPLRASARAARLLAELGGATAVPEHTHVEVAVPPVTITMAVDHPGRVAGVAYPGETVLRRLREVGCAVEVGAPAGDGDPATLTVTPPSWRPDLTAPNDLAEEVIRLEGYERIPPVPPLAPAGRGLTAGQARRRQVGRALAAAGYVEVLNFPFVSPRDWDALLLPAGDPRREAPRLANPLSEEEPLLRTTLLPGLIRALHRNVGRGFADVALFEAGPVYRARRGAPPPPGLGVDRAPTTAELAALEAALPAQPYQVAVILAGDRTPGGWWGPGRPAGHLDAIEAARVVAGAIGVAVSVRAGRHEPWHPGRCAVVTAEGRAIGHAGELHPRVVEAYGLPPRTCAMELDLSFVDDRPLRPAPAPRISAYPVAIQDVALVVDAGVPAGEVEDALRAGAGDLLESIRLFDVYTGRQVDPGRKSLAFTLRFRAPDRTLTVEETTAARDTAVAAAAARTGAVQRTG